jgi:hypothetical protein
MKILRDIKEACSLPSHQFANCIECASLAESLLDKKRLLTTVLDGADTMPAADPLAAEPLGYAWAVVFCLFFACLKESSWLNLFIGPQQHSATKAKAHAEKNLMWHE